MPDDLPMKEYRRAGLEITRGNAEVYKSMWSRRDDVTLANPFGPPVRGWQEVSDRLDLAASNHCDGRDYEFDNIATVIAPELAYTVEIERIRTRVGGSDELTPLAIRAATVCSDHCRDAFVAQHAGRAQRTSSPQQATSHG